MRFHLVLAAFVCAFAAVAGAAPPTLNLQRFVSGLSAPVEITHANDSSGRLFVVEQAGRIRIIRNGQLLPTPFLDLTPAIVLSGGEMGLLGLAFHPAYATNGRFFVYYTRANGDPNGNDIVIERYTRSSGNPDVADGLSGTTLLVIPHPQFTNHNGGKLAFGPDGYLYAGVGDGGGGGDPANAGQTLTDLRGKILRLDVDSASPYAIPPTNPFAGAGPSARGEIWAYGLRNPWRFSFDRLTGDLFIGDVGQGAWEEIDFEPRGSGGGRNYGWRVFEGTHCFNPPTSCSLANHTLPVIEYGHDSAGGFSVTGGYRYRGRALPALAGYYIYGDFVSGRIWAASPDQRPAWASTQVATRSQLSTFGEDENGELYVANLGGGTIERLTPAATTIPRMANISTRGSVRTDDEVMIGGFIIQGSQAKTGVVRARGPSLAPLGVPNTLANPTLQLYSGQTLVASNDDWGAAANATAMQASGFAPSNSLESAILVTLAPGAYTAIVSGSAGGTGIALVEVFEVDHPEVPLINLSTRGIVLTGDDVMIGGFIIQGNAPQTVVVRARGPSLAPLGLSNTLANPLLQLFSGQVQIAANDDWGTAANAAQLSASGFAPANSQESAILITLNPGAYTAIVTGVGNTTGIGIVEVFAVP